MTEGDKSAERLEAERRQRLDLILAETSDVHGGEGDLGVGVSSVNCHFDRVGVLDSFYVSMLTYSRLHLPLQQEAVSITIKLNNGVTTFLKL